MSSKLKLCGKTIAKSVYFLKYLGMNSLMSDDELNSWLEPSSEHLGELPKVSIIIPCHNCAQSIGFTLDSLLMQRYAFFEIIVIDASSKDRTLEIIKSFRMPIIRIYVVESFNRPEMLNKGISLAKGKYINFLFPGDYYIANSTLLTMMELALEKSFPDLVYSGCLIRDPAADVKLLYRPLTLELLKRGQQPTNLQSCWFKSSIFKSVGKFNSNFNERGGFDLLCRIMLQKNVKIASANKFLTDYTLHQVTRDIVLRHFIETLNILYSNFGFKSALSWLFKQKDLKRYLKLWFRSAKIAFLGR